MMGAKSSMVRCTFLTICEANCCVQSEVQLVRDHEKEKEKKVVSVVLGWKKPEAWRALPYGNDHTTTAYDIRCIIRRLTDEDYLAI